MALAAFFVLALRRLKSRASLSLLLTGATALVIALITCIPAFSGAVSLRIMQQELAERAQRHQQPPLSARIYAMGTPSQPIAVQQSLDYGAWARDRLERALDLPIDSSYTQVESALYPLQPRSGDAHYTEIIDRVAVTVVPGISEHLSVVAGQAYGTEGDDAALRVWVEKAYADRIGLREGESYLLSVGKEELVVEIAGLWEPIDPSARFWYLDPSGQMNHKLLTTEAQYTAQIAPRAPGGSAFCGWYFCFGDQRVNLARAEHYVEGLELVEREVGERLPSGSLDHAPVEELIEGNERKQSLTLILLGFSVPVIAIVIYFISVLSAMVVHFQSQEIAMLTSRGSSRQQILLLTLVETAIILLIATPLGLLGGLTLARLLGNSLGFLHFGAREPLPVYIASVEWWVIAAALLITAMSRLLPTYLASGQTIIAQERENARADWKAGLGRLMLIAFMVLTTYYTYQRLSAIGTLSLVSWEPGEQQHDPLLLLAPSLFLLTVPLVAGEVFVLLVRPLAWLGSLIPGMAGYLGLTDLGRNGGQFRRPIFMLILCLGLGVFYASLAKSADQWLLDRRNYEVGSDLTFSPEWDTDLDKYGLTEAEILEVWGRPNEVRMEEYEAIDGVVEAMEVGNYIIPSLSAPKRQIRVMAIDPWEFPQVVRYRSHYGPETFGALMNRLAANPQGVLVSENVMERFHYQVGDHLNHTIEIDKQTRLPAEFEIVGTFDYFPTRMSDTDFLLVVRLDYMQSLGAYQLPTHVWMRLTNDADPAEVEMRIHEKYRILTELKHDVYSLVVKDGERLERVGIFGMLSISFLAGAILASLGLIIHSAASMRRRSLQFAILQAIGVGRGSLMASVFCQYLVMLLYSVAVGAGLGIVCSSLYGPFFQLADTAGVPVPPYSPLVDQERAIALAIALSVVLLLVECALFIHLARTRVFETLRLGTRE